MYTIEQIHENWLQGTMSEIVAIYFLQDFGLKMEDAVKVMDEWKQKKEAQGRNP